DEQCRLPPCGNVVEAQRALAVNRRLLDVHIQAERATVELRGADEDKVEDRLFDRRFLHLQVELDELLEQLWRLLLVVEALIHWRSSFLDEGGATRRALRL